MTYERPTRAEWRAQARVELCDAIGRHGVKSAEARQAAIEFCKSHQMEPHFRYAIYPKFTEPPSLEPMMEPVDIQQIEEWEVQARRFARELGLSGEQKKSR